MIALPTTPQTAPEILETGFRIWKETFFGVIPFALLSGLVLVWTPLFWAEATEIHFSSTLLNLQPIVNLVLNCILTGAIIYRIDAIVKNKDLGLKHALYEGFMRAPRYFLTIILYGLAVFGGLVLFIVPGLILFVSLYLAPFLVIITELRTINSIKESYRLVSGSWWHAGWVILLFSLVCLTGAVIIGSIGGILIFPIISPLSQHPKVFGGIIGVIIYILGAPYLYANTMALLYDLQVRKALKDTRSIAA